MARTLSKFIDLGWQEREHGASCEGSRLFVALSRLADECAADDARATSGPWIWSDETFLWNESADLGVLQHGEALWPVSPENREVIAAARNRLPELVRVLREAAADHAHMIRMYRESREYVHALERERDDLVAAASRHVDEANRLDARIERLEKGFSEALEMLARSVLRRGASSEWMSHVSRLRGVLEDCDAGATDEGDER